MIGWKGWIGITILLLALFFGLAIWTGISSSVNKANLETNGINGTAVIESATNTNQVTGNSAELKFNLMVTVPGKAPYQANYTHYVLNYDMSHYQPGDEVYVLVDPNNPQNLEIPSLVDSNTSQ